MNLCYAHKPTKKANKIAKMIGIIGMPMSGFMLGKEVHYFEKRYCSRRK